MKKLYLVRHAHTKDNELKKYSGHSNTELSETGKKQSKQLCEFLNKNVEVNKIYVSALRRTSDTILEYANEKGIDIKKIEELNEMDFGDFDGLTLAEIEKKYPEEYMEFMQGNAMFRFPKGENIEECYNRNIEGLKKIFKNSNEDDVVMICGHMGTVRNIISYLLVNSYDLHWNIKIENATVSVIEFLGDYPILKMMGYIPYDFSLMRPHITKRIRKER